MAWHKTIVGTDPVVQHPTMVVRRKAYGWPKGCRWRRALCLKEQIMKTIFFTTVLMLLIPTASFAYGGSGACSWHGGVNCSAGINWDGSVICNDGWRDSSVSFNTVCGSSLTIAQICARLTVLHASRRTLGSSIYWSDLREAGCLDNNADDLAGYLNYCATIGKGLDQGCDQPLKPKSAPKEESITVPQSDTYIITTPKIVYRYFCPAHSFLDGVEPNVYCHCESNYLPYQGSCLDASNVCTLKYGKPTYFDSEKQTCYCQAGYYVGSDGKCSIPGDVYCSSKYGNAIYRSDKQNCYCTDDYHFDSVLGTCIANLKSALPISCMYPQILDPIKNICLTQAATSETHPIIQQSTSSPDLKSCHIGGQFWNPNTGVCQCPDKYKLNDVGTGCIIFPPESQTQNNFVGLPKLKADLLNCSVVGKKATHFYYLLGSKFIKQMTPVGKECFVTEQDAKNQHYRSGESQEVAFKAPKIETSNKPNNQPKQDFLACAAVGNSYSKLYYFKGNKIIKWIDPPSVRVCFGSEQDAINAKYKKARWQ